MVEQETPLRRTGAGGRGGRLATGRFMAGNIAGRRGGVEPEGAARRRD
jgi:hypothetical protein